MPHSSPPVVDRPRPDESPVAWFSELLIAVDRGEYRRAAEAQRHLSRLGWSVIPRSHCKVEFAPGGSS